MKGGRLGPAICLMLVRPAEARAAEAECHPHQAGQQQMNQLRTQQNRVEPSPVQSSHPPPRTCDVSPDTCRQAQARGTWPGDGEGAVSHWCRCGGWHGHLTLKKHLLQLLVASGHKVIIIMTLLIVMMIKIMNVSWNEIFPVDNQFFGHLFSERTTTDATEILRTK